jgi:hypothetical protein
MIITSFKNKAVMINVTPENAEAAAQGRKYGYLAQNRPENRFGHRFCGFENTPPIKELTWYRIQIDIQSGRKASKLAHPIVLPEDHTTGIKANPWALFVESVSSS